MTQPYTMSNESFFRFDYEDDIDDIIDDDDDDDDDCGGGGDGGDDDADDDDCNFIHQPQILQNQIEVCS